MLSFSPRRFLSASIFLFESLIHISIWHHHFFRGRAIRRKRWFSSVLPLKPLPQGKVKLDKEFRERFLGVWSSFTLLVPSPDKGGGLLRVNRKQPLLHKGRDKDAYILPSPDPFVGLDWVCCSYCWGFGYTWFDNLMRNRVAKVIMQLAEAEFSYHDPKKSKSREGTHT